jgi:two-component sensor histidine kinase
MPLAEIDPRLPDIAVTVSTPDRVNDALDAVDHPRPVDLDVLDRDPEPAGRLGLIKRMSGTDERLRGIAPSVETGASHFPLLDHGDARALAPCFGCSRAPGGASADDDQIVWCAGTARHQISLLVTSRAIDVNALIREVVATFRPLTDSHRFPLDLDPSLRTIDGDRDRLAQAITNLVSNAVKYSPAGGTVTIITRNNGDDVVISVRDEGIGVAREDLSRIFDRFERVETGIAGRIAGTGLGLSIVQEIASLHGGRLWADSELGLGSTFHLAIPASASGGVEQSRSREEDGD